MTYGTDPSGRQYGENYIPQYRPAQYRELHVNGRWHVRRTELTPWTRWRNRKAETIQGLHTTTWTWTTEHGRSAIGFSSREAYAPRKALLVEFSVDGDDLVARLSEEFDRAHNLSTPNY